MSIRSAELKEKNIPTGLAKIAKELKIPAPAGNAQAGIDSSQIPPRANREKGKKRCFFFSRKGVSNVLPGEGLRFFFRAPE